MNPPFGEGLCQHDCLTGLIMQLADHVNTEIRYRIPVALLAFLGDFSASTVKHLNEITPLMEGWSPNTVRSHAQRYVENRIKDEILIKYQALSVIPEALRTQWGELILEYREAAALANEALNEIRVMGTMRRRKH